MVADGLLELVYDCVEGGLVVIFVECCFDSGGVGVEVVVLLVGLDEGGCNDVVLVVTLFGEMVLWVVVFVIDSKMSWFLVRFVKVGVLVCVIGRMGGSWFRFFVNDMFLIDCLVVEIEHVWVNGLMWYFWGQVV